MSKIQELQDEVTVLQSAVDAEQEQIRLLLENQMSTIDQLNQTIDTLEAQLADSGTPEQLQSVIDSLKTTVADIESTVEDTTTTTTQAPEETTTEAA